jgi:hypothetical protein
LNSGSCGVSWCPKTTLTSVHCRLDTFPGVSGGRMTTTSERPTCWCLWWVGASCSFVTCEFFWEAALSTHRPVFIWAYAPSSFFCFLSFGAEFQWEQHSSTHLGFCLWSSMLAF